jgi:hypothetical protein
MRQMLLLSALALFLTGCSGWRSEQPEDRRHYHHNYEGHIHSIRNKETHPNTEELTRIVITFAAELRKDHNLFLEHSGVFFDDNINRLVLWFSSQDSLELQEGREVLFDTVEGLLDIINEVGYMTGEFGDRPLTYEDLEVHIDFQSFYNIMVDPTFLGDIVLEDGRAYFYDAELKMRYADIWEYKSEPYCKTRQIVIFTREAKKMMEERDKGKKKNYVGEERFDVGSDTSGETDNE